MLSGAEECMCVAVVNSQSLRHIVRSCSLSAVQFAHPPPSQSQGVVYSKTTMSWHEHISLDSTNSQFAVSNDVSCALGQRDESVVTW